MGAGDKYEETVKLQAYMGSINSEMVTKNQIYHT